MVRTSKLRARAVPPGFRSFWAVVLLCLLGLLSQGTVAVAQPKNQTVAVMPFRDLSGGSSYIGEAIRETVTSDLKQLGALRVVERAALDKILTEQKLQVKAGDPDAATLSRVGKILGAHLIVVGAYQKALPVVRLTARFIKVETSEIIGTAKVDGSAREFLRLQDRVTAALLKSAGLAVRAQKVLTDAAARPEMESLKAVELYGQAVVAGSEQERHQFLIQAVAEDKNYSYAVRDLDELEARMRVYQQKTLAALDQEVLSMTDKLRLATTRADIDQQTVLLMAKLVLSRRWNTLVREGQAFVEGHPADVPYSSIAEGTISLLLTGYARLHDFDGLLREGERYLVRCRDCPLFQSVKAQMNVAILQKRLIEEGQEKAATEHKGYSHDRAWQLCDIGSLYARNFQHAAAERLLQACAALAQKPMADVLARRAENFRVAGNWKALRSLLDAWRKVDERALLRFLDQFESLIPRDE